MNVAVEVYMLGGKWHLTLRGQRWMVDEMSALFYKGATFHLSGSSIMGGSGPNDPNATITFELRQPYTPPPAEIDQAAPTDQEAST